MNPNIKCTCPFGNPSIAVAEHCPIHGLGQQTTTSTEGTGEQQQLTGEKTFIHLHKQKLLEEKWEEVFNKIWAEGTNQTMLIVAVQELIEECYKEFSQTPTPEAGNVVSGELYRFVKAKERLPDFENVPDDFGVVFTNKKQVKTFTVYPSYTKNIPALLQNNLDGWEWLEKVEPAQQNQDEAEVYRKMLVDILLQIEWGEKGVPIEKRIANVFNNNPEVVVGVNEVSRSIGIQFQKR